MFVFFTRAQVIESKTFRKPNKKDTFHSAGLDHPQNNISNGVTQDRIHMAVLYQSPHLIMMVHDPVWMPQEQWLSQSLCYYVSDYGGYI